MQVDLDERRIIRGAEVVREKSYREVCNIQVQDKSSCVTVRGKEYERPDIAEIPRGRSPSKEAHLLRVLNSFVPMRRGRKAKVMEPWITRELELLVKVKKEDYVRLRKRGSDSALDYYKKIFIHFCIAEKNDSDESSELAILRQKYVDVCYKLKELEVKLRDREEKTEEKDCKGVKADPKELQSTKVHLHLDAKKSDSRFSVSGDGKNTSWDPKASKVPTKDEKYHDSWTIRASERFTSGKHYWEVVVTKGTVWSVGIAKPDAPMTRWRRPSTSKGFWTLMLWNIKNTDFRVRTFGTSLVLFDVSTIGMFLDYEAGKLSFYNVRDSCLLHTITDTFSGELNPVFILWIITEKDGSLTVM
ncbi:E3 ubiquitin-protein ligase TRIM39-like [Scyliorhinus canicula]|uniref:E3 ubiquitin-protein ligase TRIM39-like n=1 Tax=Scyliorhinus canicula TaxID=7830 RepID=UPI0018F2AE6C|nr:E3 ubiquitin-protein ligase TRIM39-like [Scyliorhinus canicula]